MSRKRSDGPVIDVFKYAMRVIVWGGVLIFCLGVIAVSCEALGRGLSGASAGGGAPDARAVTVAAAKETSSELRAEMFAQALNASGYEVRRSYGLEGWEEMRDAFKRSDGAYVVPAQASSPRPEEITVAGATMLEPAREPVVGEHPAPLVGEEWARGNPAAVEALDETSAALDPEEFAAMVEAVEDGGVPVVGAVYRWREANGLPPAPGVRPAPAKPEEEEVRI